MEKNREVPFFFDSHGRKLFGVLHLPHVTFAEDFKKKKESLPKSGIVICAPFGEEKAWSHRVFVNFARFMSEKGFAVMRFDYMGSGDSDGDSEDMTVESCLEDIATAASVLRQTSNVESFGLLGLRLGATFAASVACRVDANFIVFWDPVINGGSYFQECLRSNLATQLVLCGKVVKTRQQLIEKLNNGEPVNIDGNLVSTEFYRQVSRLDLIMCSDWASLPVLAVQIGNKTNASIHSDYQALARVCSDPGCPGVDLKIVTTEPFWKELKAYYQKPDPLFIQTASWIDSLSCVRSKQPPE